MFLGSVEAAIHRCILVVSENDARARLAFSSGSATLCAYGLGLVALEFAETTGQTSSSGPLKRFRGH